MVWRLVDPEGHSYLKHYRGRMPTTTGPEEPSADYGQVLRCYWLGRAACEATTTSRGEGPEDRKQGIAVHYFRVARDAPGGQV